MRRIVIGLVIVGGLGAAVAVSNYQKQSPTTYFPREERNPVTHLRWNEGEGDFQFALVSDRTGGHRANIFAPAVHKLNLLQPAFVLSVGDLIEGGKKTDAQYQKEWVEFDGLISKLTMPFFYVAGNHDTGVKESAKFWEGKLGRRHYHFVYRNVLFLLLDSDDPPGSIGAISAEQAAWAKQTLDDNRDVRWTVAVVHRPLWAVGNGAKNGWQRIDEALAGRPYTVFAGHVHRFQKFTRNDRHYYQLATTGGGSALRGVEQGEFDHITWVTMKKDGPVIAHVALDAIVAEDLQAPVTDEPGVKRTLAAVHPVRGQAFFEGTPMTGAVVTLTPDAKLKKGVAARGVVEPDGIFRLTTYKAYDGAAEGEYTVTVTWRERLRDGKMGSSLVPDRYGKAELTPLRATISAAPNTLIFELKR
jgi:hypothetical protein